MSAQDYKRLAQRYERQMLRTFADILDGVREATTLQRLADLIEAGDITGVIRTLRLDEGTWAPLMDQIRAAYSDGGIEAARQLGRIPDAEGAMVAARFNVRNPAAEAWLAAKSSELIVEIASEQREAVRTLLLAGLERGDNPRTTALDVIGRINQATGKREGGVIGLTAAQAGWVSGVREKLLTNDPSYFDMALRDKRLDARIAAGMASGTVPKGVIDSAVTKYQARAERYRGTVIARTETLNSLRSAQAEAVRQAATEGGVEPGKVKKIWSSSGDERTRETHLAADGQERDMDQPFEVDGELLMYPGDSSMGASASNVISCRCSTNYVLSFSGITKKVEANFDA